MVIQQPVGSALADIIASAEGNRRMSRTMLYAIIAAGLLHAGLGYYLYKQHNSIPSSTYVEPPVITVTPLPKPKPPILKPTRLPKPPPPQGPVFHKPVDTTVQPVDKTPFHPTDTDTKTGTVTQVTTDPPAPPEPPQPPRPVEQVKPQGPPLIVDPRWLSKPTADQMQRAYPPRATALEKTGHVAMQCNVLASGKVSNCAVTAENPASYGFGAAALSLAKYFKMSPQTKDGQVIDGAKVNLRLAFTLQ